MRRLLLVILIISPIIIQGVLGLADTEEGTDPNIISPISNWNVTEFNVNSEIISFDGKISGTGIPGNVTMYCNKTGGPIYTTFNTSLEIAAPNPWKIVYTNISIRNIMQDSDLITMEQSHPTSQDLKNNEYAMQFNVTKHAYLTNFSIYLYEIFKTTSYTVAVYNATLQGSYPAPHILLNSEDFLASLNEVLDYQWHNFSFSSVIELDPANTYGNAFFIVITSRVGPAGKFQWGYELDSVGVDSGAAYFYNISTWTIQAWDFSLKVGLSNISKSASEIDLRINGTSVNDKNEDDGEWISTIVYSDVDSFVSFDFSANISAFFEVEWLVSYQLIGIHQVNTYFEGFDSDNVIFWNATYEATFITGSFDKQLKFELPAWKSIMKIWKNQNVHTLWNQTIIGAVRSIIINNAADALWIIQSNDTNYMESVIAKRGGTEVSAINSTDTIEIFGNFTETLTSGDANLTIFPLEANYNDTIGEVVTSNKTIKFSPNWTPADTATDTYPEARLQVSWFNGTAAGIKTKILTVESIPTNLMYKNHTSILDAGDSIFAYVNFSNARTGDPLIDANLLVKNSTDGTTWPAPFLIIRNFLNGTYEIEILTLGLSGGVYYFSINMSEPLYLSSEIADLIVTIGGGISNISLTAPNCIGLDPINQTHALANPAPYHNSSIKVTIYYFNNLTLGPLRNGIITGTWIGGGPEIDWVSAFFGYYNITIDVTGFRSRTNHTLKVLIQEAGYIAAMLYIIVPIRKLPTLIYPLETSYSNYLEETLTIYAIFQDTFNDQSIPTVYDLNGNFTIKVGNLIDNMSLLTPSIGLYLYDLTLSTLGLTEGMIYDITFCAFSSEHEFAQINVSIYIIPKAEVELTLIGMPTYILAGNQFKVYANLTLKTGPPIIDAPITFRVRLQDPGSTETPYTQFTNGSGIAELIITANPAFQYLRVSVQYMGNVTVQNKMVTSNLIPIIILNSSLTLGALPGEIVEGKTLEISAILLINGSPAVGEKITFEFYYDGLGPVVTKTAVTDTTGTATVSLEVPSGVSIISVTARYDGLDYVTPDTSSSDVSIISHMTQFWRLSFYWLTPLGAVIGATIAYKYGYKRRKLKSLQVKWQKSLTKFQDISNIDYLMILRGETGISIYNYSFKAEELEYQLMSGFLTALSTFQKELGFTDKKGKIETGEREISYENFKIFGISRELAQFVLILEGSISDTLKDTFLKFALEVEREYNRELLKFKGDIGLFKPIDSLVKQYFDHSITLTHICIDLPADRRKKLAGLERKLYNLGEHLTESQGYFYISNMIDNAIEMLGEDRGHIIDTIYSLVAMGYFTSSRTSLLLD